MELCVIVLDSTAESEVEWCAVLCGVVCGVACGVVGSCGEARGGTTCKLHRQLENNQSSWKTYAYLRFISC